jgi:membrane protein YqaA with SNARE-associated domain
MSLVLTTLGLGLASALIPLINIEIYLNGLVAAGRVDSGQWVAVALASGVGQTCGKIIWYEVAARSMESAWVQKKLTQDKWKLSYEKWHLRIVGRPWYAGSIIFAAAFLGVPPLLVLAVVAGSLRMPRWVFIPTVLVGRVLRFYLILAGAGTVYDIVFG